MDIEIMWAEIRTSSIWIIGINMELLHYQYLNFINIIFKKSVVFSAKYLPESFKNALYRHVEVS
jgi:hypothetical protein